MGKETGAGGGGGGWSGGGGDLGKLKAEEVSLAAGLQASLLDALGEAGLRRRLVGSLESVARALLLGARPQKLRDAVLRLLHLPPHHHCPAPASSAGRETRKFDCNVSVMVSLPEPLCDTTPAPALSF